jgi:hypothetical protein
MTDLRKTAQHSRKALPIGTVRVRIHGGHRVRFIKVRMDGPGHLRWMAWARWWWLSNRGPIPAGMRVAHEDGDTLNDDPANLMLMTDGDVVANWHFNNPRLSDRNYQQCRESTARHNRERARIERARRWMPTRWYVVDIDQRMIINAPHKSASIAYRAHGINVPYHGNGRMPLGALLGWPDHGIAETLILAALADSEGGAIAGLRALRAACAAIADRYGVECSRTRGRWYSLISQMRAAGTIASAHIGARRQVYSITPETLAARGDVKSIIAVRGADLDGDRFKHFAVVDEAGQPMQRRAVA